MAKPLCRLAEWNDTAVMAELAAKAFDQNDLCGRFMHPERHKFPDDFVTFWRRDIRNHFFEPNAYFIVTTVDDPDTGNNKVVSAAKWKRQGKTAPKSTQSWATVVQHHSIHLIHTITSRIWPNRAADPSKLNSLDEAFPLFAHHWSGQREESWFLDMLSVHPDYQLRGHGRALVEWGKEKARMECICASTTSAEMKEEFYNKLGFVEVGRANVGPLSGVEGGAIMFCDEP